MADRQRRVDVVVIGLGLAGASVAWTAHELGLDVLIVDDADADAASTVAAGLVTPVTGAKLKPQPGFAALAHTAINHYRQVGERTAVHAFHERPAVRILTEQRELAALRAIENSTEAAGSGPLARFEGSLPDGVRAGGTPVIMAAAGRLAIADYVDATRRYFADRAAVVAGTVTDRSIVAGPKGVDLPRFGACASHAVFCGGYRDRDNAHFAALRWRAAKGQILELDCPGFDRRYTLHGRGVWLTAANETRVLVGATYEWDALDATVTRQAREKLAADVDSLIDLPYTIVDQRAAVRPIVEGRMPVIGRSRRTPRLWLCNGLGSKGALFAPSVATHLLAAIHDDEPIPETYCLDRRVAASS